MEKFNWEALRHFLSTKWKKIPGELDDISFPPSGKVQLENSSNISCPRSGKVWLGNSTIFHVHEFKKFN